MCMNCRSIGNQDLHLWARDGQQVEREPYNVLFGQRKEPGGQKLGRAPENARQAAEIYKSLLAAEPGADDHRKAVLRSRRSGRPGSRCCTSI